MEELVDDDNIDLDTLQAQINLSLAHTQSLVASWVDSSSSASISQDARAQQEKEIEELLRRPPRLGVGASVPASTSASSYEAIKLKGKLAGKKRAREEDHIIVSSQSDEEEESRSGAIKKKARIDPFAVGKGKKKAKNAEPPPLPPTSTKKPSSEHSKPSGSKQKEIARPIVDADDAVPAQIKAPEAATGKKRKKKKRKGAATTLADLVKPVSPAVDKPVEVIVIDDSPPRTPEPPAMLSASPEPPIEIPKTPDPVKRSVAGEKLPHGMPLLNLDGPPPVLETTPTKKKRRRKKKKKFDHAGQGTASGEAMDVDDQEDPLDHPDSHEDDR